ncbi:MAG TPA: hypothetical protein VIL49_10440 [Capillimicrobium sp.]
MLTAATVALTAALAGSTLTWTERVDVGTAVEHVSFCEDGTVHGRYEGLADDGTHHLGFSDGRWKVVAAESRRRGVVRLTGADDGRPSRQTVRLRPKAATAVLDGRAYRWSPDGADC